MGLIRERPASKERGAQSQTDLVALAGREEVTATITVVQEKTITAKAEPEDNWVCWKDPDELVVETQPRTCCYLNTRDQIVLRQQSLDYDEEDPYLVFNKEYAPRIIHAFAKHLSPGAMMDIMRALEKNYLL